MPAFKHSGDLGDIVYSLPAVKALGGGLIYLDTSGGATDEFVMGQRLLRVTTRFNQRAYDTIRPLLLRQPYVEDVRPYEGQQVDHNLNAFRPLATDTRTNLAALHLRAFGLDEKLADLPWLAPVSDPIKLPKRLAISRSPRYQCKYLWWDSKHKEFSQQGVFIGHSKEHEMFEYTFDCKIDYFPTADAFEVARVLTGSAGLIGNQSLAMAIAIGLGRPFVQEFYDWVPNCIFRRENGRYVSGMDLITADQLIGLLSG